MAFKRLKVSRPPNTYLIQISYQSENPQLAADAANAIVESYLEHIYNIRIRSSASLSTFMERQIEELKATIRARHPDAQFSLSRAPDDRHIWHLWTAVDVLDPDEVKALTRDREFELLVEDHVPLYVIVTRGPQRSTGYRPAMVQKTG